MLTHPSSPELTPPAPFIQDSTASVPLPVGDISAPLQRIDVPSAKALGITDQVAAGVYEAARLTALNRIQNAVAMTALAQELDDE